MSIDEESWRTQDDSEDDREVTPMEVNHMRRKSNPERPPTRERERAPRGNDNWHRDREYRAPPGYRDAAYQRYVPSCWTCGRRGHLQRFCPGNGATPFIRRPVNGWRQ